MAPLNTPQDGDRSALAALPVHTTPWLPTGHRDQDARLLVNAMYRQRDQLLRDAPNVPVQGYEVMPISAGASGAMTCGTLISLWHASPFCRGECPSCGDQALAFTVGGSDGDWLVLGVCPFCAGVSFRAGPEAELLAELERDLLGTGYALPTAWQLLTSFGQQHTALLAALAECGEVLLPAFHYGFTPGRPETMRGWANSGRARARHWACRVTVRHAPSGARVEQTEAIVDEVARFVERHLVQTGRLPELEYDGAAGLRYCFPLISQEPVIPASVPDDDDDDEYREESDSDAYQGDVDTLIASARGGVVDAAALKRVTDHIEGEGIEQDETLGLFLNPDAIQSAFQRIDDGDVREALELPAGRRVSRAQRIEYLEQCVLPGLFEDADATHLMVPVVLQASNGDEMTLIAGIQGYSFTVIETTWWGPVESAEAFQAWLGAEGWVEGVEEFEALPLKRKAEIVRGECRR